MAGSTNRNVYIYINNKQVENNIRSIRKEGYKLRNELAGMTRGTDEYRKKMQELKRVDGILKDHNRQVRGTQKIWARIKTEVKQFGALALTYLGGQALLNGLNKMVERLASMDDAMTDVMKTTGLTKQEVQDLNRELSKLNTRTGRKELLMMARDAGKLGITAKKDILEFVRAANQINVALGEDLGAEATKTVGKLVNIFRLDETFGLEKSMLKIGSAINELGMASTASEGRMVDFIRRMGGIAPLANMTAPQVLALGATLDSLGQTSEVSSTALSKLFIKMASESDTYARIAGMNVQEFNQLMNENALEAFIKVLEAAGQTEGGIVELTATLGELGVEGGRATGVFGALANSTDKLREQMDVANKAFDDGTSITEEYANKNENLAASLERVQKWLAKVFLNNPISNGIGNLIIGLDQLVNKTRRYSDELRDEQTEINSLVLSITSLNEGNKVRDGLIDELLENYGDYFEGLDKEKAKNEDLLKVLKEINAEMETRIMRAVFEEEIQDWAKAGQEAMRNARIAAKQYGSELERLQEWLSTSISSTDYSQMLNILGDSTLDQAEKVRALINEYNRLSDTPFRASLTQGSMLAQMINDLGKSANAYSSAMNQYHESLQEGSAVRAEFQEWLEAAGLAGGSGEDDPDPKEDPVVSQFQQRADAIRATMDTLMEEFEIDAKLIQDWASKLDKNIIEILFGDDEEMAKIKKEVEDLMALEDKILTQDMEKQTKAKQEEINEEEKLLRLRERQSEMMFFNAVRAVEGAETTKEALQGVARSMRDTIKMEIARGVAASVAEALTKVPFPANIIIAGAAGAAASALFDRIVPQFYMGGMTDVVGAQDGRKYRAAVRSNFYGGMVDQPSLLVGERGQEYVIDNWTLQQPEVANLLPMIEAIRTSRQAFMGGFSMMDFRQEKRLKQLESQLSQPSGGSTNTPDRLVSALEKNNALLEHLATYGVQSKWEWDEFQEGIKKGNDSEAISQV